MHYVCSLPSLALSDSFMHIACAGISPLLQRGSSSANNKRTIRRATSLYSTSNQSEYNTWSCTSHGARHRLLIPTDLRWREGISICKLWASKKEERRQTDWRTDHRISVKSTGMSEIWWKINMFTLFMHETCNLHCVIWKWSDHVAHNLQNKNVLWFSVSICLLTKTFYSFTFRIT